MQVLLLVVDHLVQSSVLKVQPHFYPEQLQYLRLFFFTTSLSLAVLSGKSGNDVDIMDVAVVEVLETELPMVDGEQVIVDEPLIEVDVPEIVGEASGVEEGVPTIEVEEGVVTP